MSVSWYFEEQELRKQLAKAEEKLRIAVEALGFYAESENYKYGDYESHVIHDKGAKATTALQRIAEMDGVAK